MNTIKVEITYRKAYKNAIGETRWYAKTETFIAKSIRYNAAMGVVVLELAGEHTDGTPVYKRFMLNMIENFSAAPYEGD